MPVPEKHFVNGNTLTGPFADNLRQAVFGLGCFWGAERRFWETNGVFSTAVGYSGGITPNPSYEEVCSGMTGHTEVVLVVYDPAIVSYDDLLRVFWESHDPTQGMRQGNDIGTQYRSAIYTYDDEQQSAARRSLAAYNAELGNAGFGDITTEVLPLDTFYYAEGASYLSNDAKACANCHVMQGHYDAWIKSSHRSVAKCNDCHAPHGSFVNKYYCKARNGFFHSFAFTTGNFPDQILINDYNRGVTEEACRHCHSAISHDIDFEPSGKSSDRLSCIRCHTEVGHSR